MGTDTSDLRRRFEKEALPFAGVLFATAMRVVGRPEDAEEVVQETFLRGYRTFQNFREGSNAKAWLFTILYSIVKNRYRQASRRPTETSLTELEETNPAPLETRSWGSHEALLRELDVDRMPAEIVEAFAALPPPSRMIILLVEVEELEYDEVARILDCPVGTVASRLYRARRQLFDRLAPYVRDRGYCAE